MAACKLRRSGSAERGRRQAGTSGRDEEGSNLLFAVHTHRRRALPSVIAAVLLVALAASSALAATKSAVGSVTPSSAPVPAGTTKSYTFSLTPTNGSIGSFNLDSASGWRIVSLDAAPGGVTLASATQIRGRNLSIGSASPLSVTFTAQAPCGTLDPLWGLTAKSGGNFTGSSFAVDPASSLSTPLDGACHSAFVGGRGPADAALNGHPRSENITSVAYTPSGAAMQVKVTDAEGTARSNVSIQLTLCTTPVVCSPTSAGAALLGPLTSVSGGDGVATFTGTPANPISIDTIGLNYRLQGTGSGVTPTPSDPFGIYEEGEQCGPACSVHGKSGDNAVEATVSADTPSGSLSVLVSDLGLDCGPAIPAGYQYEPLSSSVIAWKYTGSGSQTIVVRIDKSLLVILDRGSAHIDFCYLVEGIDPDTGQPKTFTDKFGVVTSGPALLPDCSPTITENCIVSETAAQGGDRLVTVTVEDGRGKT